MRIGFRVVHIVIILSALFTAHCAQGRPQLSSEAYISLLTCSPGKMLYEAFGHSAFRVYDPVDGIDITFNYGTFDFDRPGFYSNYAKGRPVFMLSIVPTRYFINSYVMDNRSVFEDVLNLTPQQTQRLFDFLNENYRPENRYYVYDYIFDNCSTRLRYILEKLLAGNIEFDSTYIKRSYSFRELIDIYTHQRQPWGDLAIDLALGSEIDAKATPYQCMFLPDFLKSGFQHAKITVGDSVIPLIKSSKVIFKAGPEEVQTGFFPPAIVFWMLFFAYSAITLFDLRRKKITIIADMPLFAVAGLVGIILTYISFFSDHHAKGNYNLLWALPTHLVFALLLPVKGLKLVRTYSLIAAVLAVAVLFGGITVLPQQMHFAIIPVILTLAMRAAFIYKMNS